MANLRRHFNFSTKSSLHESDLSFNIHRVEKHHFDKCSLMKDICNCLESCCTYIQTLNSLCGAGSSLAKSLFHAVQDVPAYHNISEQFLAIWEEVSKATAGASASVKTETLMMLQEVLNTLDMEPNDANMDDTITESFQVIGTCLCSFIELQAQFSWSTWKSLSKLSKNFANDSFRHTLQWKSNDRSPFKISRNSDLNQTVKKHFGQLFCKVGISKVNENPENLQSQFYTSSSLQGDRPYSCLVPQTVNSSNPSDSPIWSPQTAMWSSSTDGAETNPSILQQCAVQDANLATVTHSELDEVINLLSCAPVQQQVEDKLNTQYQEYFTTSANCEELYRFWPKSSVSSASKRNPSNRSWSKNPRDIMFAYDSCIWQVDDMSCSGIPVGKYKEAYQHNEIQAPWENPELQKWNINMCETGSSSDDASSIQGHDTESFPSEMYCSLQQHILDSVRRRHNSGESLPGGLDISSCLKDVTLWDLRSSKLSTWPLKQSPYRANSENETCGIQLQSKYSPLGFIPGQLVSLSCLASSTLFQTSTSTGR